MTKKVKNQKGITLVALVVTIIVIIILSTVTISAVFGDDGMLKKAQEIKDTTQNSIAEDEGELNTLLTEYANLMGGGNETGEGNPDEPDTTPPSISLSTSETEDSITVIVTASDESGLLESGAYEYYLDNVQQGMATTESTKTFTGLKASTEYTIKVIVKDIYGNPATEEVKVSTSAPEVPGTVDEAKPNPDEDGPVFIDTTPITDDEGNTIVIPGGFHLDEESGTKVEEGIVIEDEKGNQFVWIPTGTYQTSSGAKTNNLTRRLYEYTGDNKPANVTEIEGDNQIREGSMVASYFYGEGDSRSGFSAQIDSFKKSAETTENGGNGGFYIGRYEQGTGNVCQKGLEMYGNVTRNQAVEAADAMYNGNKYVISELINSYAWDTALNFICQTNPEGYTLATNAIGVGSRHTTGGNINDKYSNIYDFCGNCCEWTTEYSESSINKDGHYTTRGGIFTTANSWAASRTTEITNQQSANISFRVQLYIK